MGSEMCIRDSCCTTLPQKFWDEAKKIPWIKCATLLVLLVMSVCYIVGSSNHPFLYFNF